MGVVPEEKRQANEETEGEEEENEEDIDVVSDYVTTLRKSSAFTIERFSSIISLL